MPDDAQQLPTLSHDDQAAVQRWVRRAGPRVDGHRCRAADRWHPEHRGAGARRWSSDGAAYGHPFTRVRRATRRCCARSRRCGRLAGTPVPHPGFHRRVRRSRRARRGVLPDGGGRRLQPRRRHGRRVCRDAGMRHQVGLSYAASLAQLGNVAWEGSPLAELKRPGSFLERQVPQFLRLARELSPRARTNPNRWR